MSAEPDEPDYMAELLALPPIDALPAVTHDPAAIAAEVARLRRGELTPDELAIIAEAEAEAAKNGKADEWNRATDEERAGHVIEAEVFRTGLQASVGRAGFESTTDYLEAVGATSPAADDQLLVLPAPTNPMAVARRMVAERFTHDGTVAIRAWRGSFSAWDGRCWPERDAATVRSEVYRFLETAQHEAVQKDGTSELRPWAPTRLKIANVLEALEAVVHLPETVQQPSWLDGGGLNPRELLVTANGILHLPTRQLAGHDPRLFTAHAVPFDYQPDAPAPVRWQAFLRELWGDDDLSVALLQELFGYMLSGDTGMQKIALLVGPTRAGKGVIANTLSALVGRHNVGAPTLAGLTTNFGLQDLIGKSVAVVSDARLGRQANVAALAERLLSISGEDAITIDRKYRDPWTGRLGVRFLLLTNELPRFSDASGALAKRFVILVLTKSVYGREDPALLSKLLPELPGILNWSLDGLDRLRAQGHFTEPASARAAIRELEDLASPIGAFLRDRCVVGRDRSAPVDDLWSAWKAWCEDGSQHHGTKQTFGRDLRAAVAGLQVSRIGGRGDQHRTYSGVGLASSSDNNADDRDYRDYEHETATTDRDYEALEPAPVASVAAVVATNPIVSPARSSEPDLRPIARSIFGDLLADDPS